MSTRIEEHKQELAAVREKLNTALDKIGDRGDEQIYSDGAQWTLRQLVIHLSVSDTGHNNMCYYYAEGKPFIPDDYDVNRYNKRSVEKRAEVTLEQARTALEKSRQELLTWLDSIDEAVLGKTGRHPAKESMTISEILNFQALHEDSHMLDIVAHLETARN